MTGPIQIDPAEADHIMALAEGNNQISIPIGEGSHIVVGFSEMQVLFALQPTPQEGASSVTARVNSSFARLLARLLISYADRLDEFHAASRSGMN